MATEIRAELGRQRISIREVGRRLGLGPNSIQQRMANGAHIDVGELHQIAAMLRVPVERFFPAQSPSREGVRNVSTWRMLAAA